MFCEPGNELVDEFQTRKAGRGLWRRGHSLVPPNYPPPPPHATSGRSTSTPSSRPADAVVQVDLRRKAILRIQAFLRQLDHPVYSSKSTHSPIKARMT